ncbi:Tryptophan--tRNA ligase, mitochondrial [Colletotrichum tanaceti]|uniref:Tryptophan--tRNA ligase, mitochondrial n=1 Tax=Colletotrichum tanaceti TaxID=1306861 RepID=A0A4U6XV00_9PEZI|nr:Tryptophan--tRNA ligase, mitochondrial [Colletotrichum tanaceti]TKW59669.1 Tryptophan--tRNA ligase, mitochondrial [Colletotrichum tanaceti]
MWRHMRPVARRFRISDGRRAASTEKPKIIFSGIQPTGTPHLGNYAGAIRQWVRLQSEPADHCKLLYSVVDLHAITVPQQAKQLKQWKRETLAALLAAGIDPERSILFYQSSVSAHSELMWILSCTASIGYLSRMTQWKSKLSLSSDATILDEGAKASLKLGLFSYPVLQAADILVHRATHVPVGDDQRQHLEFARECVTNFNHNFGPHLVSPETITSTARRVMSLQQPKQKMSKSAADPRSRILITDTPEEIHKKIMCARTDSSNQISYDPDNRPGVSNLLEILSIFDAQGRKPAQLAESHSQESLKDLKQAVSAAVVQGLDGIRERYFNFLSADEGRYLDAVEAQGAKRARLSAEETMAAVREATGL